MQKMRKIRMKRVFCIAVLSFWLLAGLSMILWLLARYARNAGKKQAAKNASEEIQVSTLQSIPEKISERNGCGISTETTAFPKENQRKERKASETEKKNSSKDAVRDTSTTIRVCIRTDHYENELHDSISIASKAPWALFEAAENSSDPDDCKAVQKFEKEDVFSVSSTDFSCGTHLIAVSSCGKSFYFPELRRDIPRPEYEGKIHLYVEKEGLRVVNEVELETYLKSVVASEMPSSYPLEALKAQAVCARTYAVRRMEAEKNKNSFSDLDDSVSFQVYNNQIMSDASARAVDETKGEILPFSEALYYSTAYVPGSDLDLSDNEVFEASLKALPDENAEYGSLWVRWHTVLNVSSVLAQLKQRSGEAFSFLDRIEVSKRSFTGQANELLLVGDGREVRIEGEYEIRAVLAPKEIPVCLNNGQEITGLTLLPSAWLSIEAYDSESGTLSLSGGGYGHGTGMSQCGAAAMAENGADYQEILDYYYGESELEHVKNS